MIVIPMAGASSRFTKAGYPVKKYRLLAHGHTMFAWSLCSFHRRFNQEDILFICNAADRAAAFIHEECAKVGLTKYAIYELPHMTRGQAETVYLGLQQQTTDWHEPLMIFNIDTIRANATIPAHLFPMSGYIETFKGEGNAWSFVVPGKMDTVLMTTEKVRVSDQCSTGLYYFASVGIFMELYENTMKSGVFERQWGERYICPMYNTLIEHGHIIKHHEISPTEIAFAGTPAEYEEFSSRLVTKRHIPLLNERE